MGALYLGNTLVAPVIQGKPNGIGYSVTEESGVKSIGRNWAPVDLAGASKVENGAFVSYFQTTYQVISSSYTGPAIINAGNNLDVGPVAFYYTFNRNTGVTSTGLSTLINVQNAYCFYYTFYHCDNLTNPELQNLQTAAGAYTFYYCFAYSGIEVADLDNLTTINGTYAFADTFAYCASLREVKISKLTTINGTSAMAGCFQNCTALESVSFDSLETLPIALVNYMFKSSGIQHLYFPALKQITGTAPTSTNAMLNGVSGCTVHLPVSMAGSVSVNMFGGTNTILLFDQGEVVTVNITIPSNVTGIIVQGQYFNVSDSVVPVEVDPTETIELYAFSNDDSGRLFTAVIPAEDYVIDLDNGNYTTTSLVCSNYNVSSQYYNYAVGLSGSYYMSVVGLDTIRTGSLINAFDLCIYYRESIGDDTAIVPHPNDYRQENVTPGSTVYFRVGQNVATMVTAADLATQWGLTYGVADNGWEYNTYTKGNETYECIKITSNNTINWHSSKSISVATSVGALLNVAPYSCASSEKNYDFGYIKLTEGSTVDLDASQIKNDNSSSMYKNSGVNDYFTAPGSWSLVLNCTGTSAYINVGYASDSSQFGGDDAFYLAYFTINVFTEIPVL